MGDSSTEEYGVTIASSVAGHLLRQQELAVGLAVSGASDVALPLDRGERQLDRILEMLAVSHATRDTPLVEALAHEESRLQRNTVLVIITPSTALDWPQGLHHLQRRGVRPFVILMDPHTFNDALSDNQRTHDALIETYEDTYVEWLDAAGEELETRLEISMRLSDLAGRMADAGCSDRIAAIQENYRND